MIDTNSDTRGVALLCDDNGVILETVRDEIELGDRVAAGQSFIALVDGASVEKALSFLATLHSQGAAFDWVMNVAFGERLTAMHFTGGAVSDRFLIVGATSTSGVARFYEELMQINSEQVNALRSATKTTAVEARARADSDYALYDEMSRLNNELATMQRELAKKNIELGKLNEQKNQFIGMAAHDLRNPLGVIQTYSDFLLRDAKDCLSQEQIKFISIIRRKSEFMLRLINDLLQITRIESGRLQLELQLTDLTSLVERHVSLNRLLAERKQIELLFSSEDSIPPMMLDSPKIEQVLDNLVSNAIKFSHPGTTVKVGVSLRDRSAVITVKDQGQGIPSNEVGKIFEPFVKTSVRATGGEQSTGLGLAIVQRIVTGHRGKLHVESEAGKGSTFTVLLPIESGRD